MMKVNQINNDEFGHKHGHYVHVDINENTGVIPKENRASFIMS